MAEAQPKKYFKDQYDDEEVLLVFRKHPVVMRKGLIMFMLAISLGTIPVFITDIPTLNDLVLGLLAGVFIGTIIALPSWIHWYFSVYILTDQRFIQVVQKGFFTKSFSDIGLHQVQSVNYQVVGLQETLLKFGTIVVQTYLGDMIINDVHHPSETTKEMVSILREHGDVLQPNDDDTAKITGRAARTEQ